MSTSSPDILTTGEAAKILHCSQQTVIRLFDSGDLKGWRIPGSKFRRMKRADVLLFAKKNNIPAEGLPDIIAFPEIPELEPKPA